MNEKSFAVLSGGRMIGVEEVDDGFVVRVEPLENVVEIHVKKRAVNGNGVHKSESVWAYKRVTKRLPNVAQIEMINEAGIDDVERWEEVVRAYMESGGWWGSIPKMLDIYHGKKAPLGTPKAREPEAVHEPLSRFYR